MADRDVEGAVTVYRCPDCVLLAGPDEDGRRVMLRFSHAEAARLSKLLAAPVPRKTDEPVVL